jgi:c-di-GMP-binding flagellar brake protein YcgR
MSRPDQQPESSYYLIPSRRHYLRYTVQVPIELQPENCETILSTETTDLSRNGCYVRLRNPLPLALRLHAVLWLGTVPIQVEGRVVTRHPEFGNGIMFLKIQDRDEKTLTTYLEAVTAEATI